MVYGPDKPRVRSITVVIYFAAVHSGAQRMLVHHFLEYYARNTPTSPCLTLGDQTVSYGEVDRLTNQLANGLLALGVSRGQRVAILGENSLEHLLLFLFPVRL